MQSLYLLFSLFLIGCVGSTPKSDPASAKALWLPAGETLAIDRYGTCAVIINRTPDVEIYVPLDNAEAWQSFTSDPERRDEAGRVMFSVEPCANENKI